MIVPQFIEHLETLRPYYKGPMLLLGDQQFKVPFNFGCKYQTLDIQGNVDIKQDLTKDISHLGKFGSVFNLGTLEHIWDIHTAYSNVMKMVELGGYYIAQSPAAGWEGHCIHVTQWRYIIELFTNSGFKLETHFFSDFYQVPGSGRCDPPSRNCGKTINFWCAFKKIMDCEVTPPIDLC